jgi:hypothetical protein
MANNDLTVSEGILTEGKLIIDEYFNNGFHKNKAVRKYRPNVTYNTASVIFNTIMKKPEIIKYVNYRREQIRSSLAIKEENVLLELMNWLRADATDFIGLTPDQLRDLPSEVRRCIQSVNYKETEFIDKNGNKKVTRHCEVKIIDKLRALEMINKHINFYEADNASKSRSIDLSKASPDQLNAILDLVSSQKSIISGGGDDDVIDL